MAQGRKIRGVFWRDGKWWIRWACSLGHDHRKPSGDLKTAATEEHKAKRAEVREARKVGRECCPRLVRRDRPSTFADLLDRYLKRRDLRASDSTEQDRRRRKEWARVEFFRKRFRGRLAGDITSKDIEEVYRELRERALPPRGDSKAPRKSAPATVNRYMKLIHAVLRFGVRQGLISANPASALEFLKENNARNRCLSDEEAGRLMAALPEWLRPLVIVAVHTGMRRGELLDLRWSDADLVNGQLRIRRDKAGDGRWVALNSEALAALKALKRDRTIMSPLVFCSPEGKTLRTNFGRYWRGVLAKAKVHDFRFHDLRHTFASWLVMDGVDLYTVQRAGGWKTATMVQRYAHLSPEHMRAAVERLAQRTNGSAAGTGTKTGTRPTTAGYADAAG